MVKVSILLFPVYQIWDFIFDLYLLWFVRGVVHVVVIWYIVDYDVWGLAEVWSCSNGYGYIVDITGSSLSELLVFWFILSAPFVFEICQRGGS